MAAQIRLRTYQAVVNRRLEELLPAEDVEPQTLHAAMRYACLAPGKRIRPILCLASARAVGGDEATHGPALDAACALELVHCFSLIHDDLPAIDNDSLRRGVETTHVKFGEALAILAGDALFALSFEVMSAIPIEPAVGVRCISSLARASGSGGLVGGEVVDVLSEGKPATAAAVQFIHERKTGALIAAACEIGARIGGGTEDQVASLRIFGEHVGLAFQIADDILNELSTAEALGKAAGSDKERSKATYPAVHGIEGARKEAERLATDAKLRIAEFPNSEELSTLASYVIDRMH